MAFRPVARSRSDSPFEQHNNSYHGSNITDEDEEDEQQQQLPQQNQAGESLGVLPLQTPTVPMAPPSQDEGLSLPLPSFRHNISGSIEVTPSGGLVPSAAAYQDSGSDNEDSDTFEVTNNTDAVKATRRATVPTFAYSTAASNSTNNEKINNNASSDSLSKLGAKTVRNVETRVISKVWAVEPTEPPISPTPRQQQPPTTTNSARTVTASPVAPPTTVFVGGGGGYVSQRSAVTNFTTAGSNGTNRSNTNNNPIPPRNFLPTFRSGRIKQLGRGVVDRRESTGGKKSVFSTGTETSTPSTDATQTTSSGQQQQQQLDNSRHGDYRGTNPQLGNSRRDEYYRGGSNVDSRTDYRRSMNRYGNSASVVGGSGGFQQGRSFSTHVSHRSDYDRDEGQPNDGNKWKLAFWIAVLFGVSGIILVGLIVWLATRKQVIKEGLTLPPVAPPPLPTNEPTPLLALSPPTVPPFPPPLLPNGNPSSASTPNPTPMPTAILTPAPTLMPTPPKSSTVPTLDQVRFRGSLRCGILPEQPGFSTNNTADQAVEGFDVDLCRAVGAAALGRSNNNVEFIAVETQKRFQTLQSGDVDILASLASHTMERDVFETGALAGFTFSIPYLYSGLTFGGIPPFSECADDLDLFDNSNTSCAELRICVEDGTTFVERVKEIRPNAALVVVPSLASVYRTFIEGFCNVIAGDVFEVAESVVRANGFTQEYSLGKNVYTRELVGLVTRDDDARWSDFVNWALQSLLAAEEQGITRSNAAAFSTTEFFGPSFENLFIDAIATVGNYGEIYERHLQGILPRTEVNQINLGTSGLILSIPFGNVNAIGPGPVPGGTLQTIRNRGHLRCGITRFPGFGEFDVASGTWKGLDVDFCRAVSAAIFNGVSDDIDFRVQPATVRFTSLQRGDVDLLSRITTWTLERDVMEGTTGDGFSFAQPNFYDGIAFGGIPPFGNCADRLDTTSSACSDLRICVNDGTTTIIRIRELFAERFIVPNPTGEAAVRGLIDGQCNAIAGSVLQIVEGSVRDIGYEGPYETGTNRFSKEPLAIVTRQDDPQFTAFVNWIVSATFYAEENSVGLANPEAMPMVSLFGPFYGRMMIDAIQTVGNYGEIYARNVEESVPRGGLNAANANPLGAQHYPLPGI